MSYLLEPDYEVHARSLQVSQEAMLISGVIIAKDEEDRISKALISLSKICDEVIVLDTGSSDSTPSIAAEHGAQVFFTEWQSDFSKARNTALSFCIGDIIITIDADEEIVDIDRSYLEKIFGDPSIGAAECTIINALEEGNISTSHTYTRIFRNRSQIRYEGRIHEQIRNSVEKLGLTVAQPIAVIHHTGYSVTNPQKIDRNREMLLEELAQNRDPFLLFHLAETEFAANSRDKAFLLFDEAFNSKHLSIPQNEQSCLRMAQIQLARNNYQSVANYLSFKSDNIHREGFRKYILAASMLAQDRLHEARELYEAVDVEQSDMVDKTMLVKARETLTRALT